MLNNYGNKYFQLEKQRSKNRMSSVTRTSEIKKTRQVSYVENRTMNMIEIVNNIVSISFDLKRQDVKVPLHLPTYRQQSE